MIYLLVLLFSLCLCWGWMIGELISYSFRAFKFKRNIKNAPDCCMCGAEDAHQCGNHVYLSQVDWYRESYKPKIR